MVRSALTSATSRSKGTSWWAKAPSAVSRTRRSSSRKVGSPSRSVRSTRVLAKKPTIPSVSGRVRPEIGAPTTTSGSPV
jgi:hypothetical protein